MAFASNRERGLYGEQVALEALEKRGYKLITRNFLARGGEIDLIMEHGKRLVFVEVKTRRGASFGDPFESITVAKRERLYYTAQVYISQYGREEDEVSFCAVGVFLGPDNAVKKVEILDPAF